MDSRDGNGFKQDEITDIANKKRAQEVRTLNKGFFPRRPVHAQFIYGKRIFISNYEVCRIEGPGMIMANSSFQLLNTHTCRLRRVRARKGDASSLLLTITPALISHVVPFPAVLLCHIGCTFGSGPTVCRTGV